MRILFITPMFPCALNIQHGIFVLEFAEALQRLGHDVRIASLEPRLPRPFSRIKALPPESAMGQVPSYSKLLRLPTCILPRNFLMSVQIPVWAAKASASMEHSWRGWKPEIVHSHTLYPGAAVADRIASRWSVQHVATTHGADTRVHIGRLIPRTVIGRLLRGGLHVACVGDTVMARLRRLAPGTDRLRVIHNGCDLQKRRPAPPELRKQFNGRSVVLSVGNLVSTKGFDFLLTAFAKLKDDFTDWDLVIVGGGPEKKSLLNRISRLNLGPRVVMTGPVRPERVMEWMDLAELFCLPSWSEGYGIVYLEALASGKPAIGIDGQGIARTLREHQVGLLAKPRDADDLAEKLRDLMGNHGLRRSLGNRARVIAERCFSWEHCAEQYIHWYEQVLGNRTCRAAAGIPTLQLTCP